PTPGTRFADVASFGGPRIGSQDRKIPTTRSRPIRLRLHGRTLVLPIRDLLGPSAPAEVEPGFIVSPRMGRLALSEEVPWGPDTDRARNSDTANTHFPIGRRDGRTGGARPVSARRPRPSVASHPLLTAHPWPRGGNHPSDGSN